MPLDERRARNDALFQVLMANDGKSWGERFLIALTRPQKPPNSLEVEPARGNGSRWPDIIRREGSRRTH